MECIFDAACPLTYNATTHKLNSNGQNVTLAAGDSVFYVSDGTIVFGFISKANGAPVIEALTADAAPDTAADYLLEYDTSAGVAKKVLMDTVLRTALNAAGSAPIYAARAFVNFNGSGVLAIRASGNVTSVTDNGVGDYTVNLTTAMSDVNYCWQVTHNGDRATIGSAPTIATGSLRFQLIRTNDSTAQDASQACVTIFR
jgi:hypothetical protein